MRLLPRSLFGRMLGAATLTTLAALIFAAISIGHVLERFVIHSLDQQLDAEAQMLARTVRPDGVLDQRRIVNLPAFDARGDGWGWRVDGARGRWTGGDAIDLPSAPDLQRLTRPGHDHGLDRDGADMRPGDSIAASGEPVHFRQMTIATTAGSVFVTVAGPRQVALAPLREAMVPLLGSLALLAAGLAIATAVQLRIGLRPLHQLRAALADVRMGRADHVPSRQPNELVPLASELNTLFDQNKTQLEHARQHVANLAHGLKTPLAAIALKLVESGRDPDGSLGAMIAEIDGRVRHHLGRARAASPGAGPRARTMLLPAITDLVGVMQSIHSDRVIAASLDISPDIFVAVDPQDLDEMLGNLLDNAWRYAGSAIQINATPDGMNVALSIEDDGPGLSAAAIAAALVPGRRLDEASDGYGFGLSITQELAELNGGGLELGRTGPLGGLRVLLTLPMGSATK